MAGTFLHTAAAGRRQPIAWFDTRLGMAADCSTWTARVGNYVATQDDPNLRYTRPGAGDARPNWLGTTLESYMDVPNIQLNGATGLTILAAFEINQPQASTGQSVVDFPDGSLYSYAGNLEFFVTEYPGSSYSSNPTAPLTGYQYVVAGGDAQTGRYPSSRSFVSNVLNSGYNRMADRTQPFADGAWRLFRLVGRLRHILIFPYVLTDAERAYWTTRLANTLP